MKIMKYSIFTRDEFIQWQKESERNICQVSPIANRISGGFNGEDSLDMKPDFDAFVLYWEES